MLSTTVLNIITSFISISPTDPLDQFEVTIMGVIGYSCVFHNLALVLLDNATIFGLSLGLFSLTIATNLDFTLKALYHLVRSIVKENLYIAKQQYFTILFYLFTTVLLANAVGLLPYSFTATSSFVVTFFFALLHFNGVNLIGVSKHRWQLNELFLPSGAPLPIIPFLVVIEAISYSARVLSLSIRLFANMMSGHALLKILISFSWSLLTSGAVGIIIALIPWGIVTAVMFLELLIAFLQSYVFVILVTLYINDVLTFHG